MRCCQRTDSRSARACCTSERTGTKIVYISSLRARASRTRHEIRREREVGLILVLLASDRVRDPQAETDEGAWRRHHNSELLRLGRPGLDVLLRHGKHLKFLSLRGERSQSVSGMSMRSMPHERTLGTAAWKLTPETGCVDVNLARMFATFRLFESRTAVRVMRRPLRSYAS